MSSAAPCGVIDREPNVSTRRKVASVFFGLFYGGSLVNGIEEAFDHILQVDNFALVNWPWVYSGVIVVCAGLTGVLAAYSSRSFFVGSVASAIISAIQAAAFKWLPYNGPERLPVVVVSVMFSVGIVAAYLSSQRLEIRDEDLATGRLLGISWKHWLWLWLPWQLTIANAVWLAYPPALLSEGQRTWRAIVSQAIRVPLYLFLLSYGWARALQCLQAEACLTQVQSAMRFLLWTIAFPILVGLLRFIGW